MLEKLLKKLRSLPLKDVICKFDFIHASQEQFDAFSQAFNIETKIPDWMKNCQDLHEEGEGKFQGMDVKLKGKWSRNPNYERPPARHPYEIEREENLRRLGETTLLFWEAIVKGIITIDRDKMIALCHTYPCDWDHYYGIALRYFSKIEKTECCK